MPKNKGKRGNNMKSGKNEAGDRKIGLVRKEDGQEYALVLRMLDNGQCEAICVDNVKRLCHIPDKMHKKVCIGADDIILVGLRNSQDDKADVILKYMPVEVLLLEAFYELPVTGVSSTPQKTYELLASFEASGSKVIESTGRDCSLI